MSHYRRGGCIDAATIIDLLLKNEKLPAKEKIKKANFVNCSANMTSLRLRTFALKGLKCARCERVGSFFAYEAPIKSHDRTGWHLNLYAINEDGSETMMTLDHIFPRSRGGLNSLSNAQTMCEPCNHSKSDKI